MEFSTIPDWLMNSMEKKKVGEVQPIEDIDDFLARIGKAKEKNKAKKFSKITRDDSRSGILQVAIPAVDKPIDEITPMDYQVTIIDLGPSTKQQEFQELNDFAKAIKA